jgi:hypothetical protein
MAAPSQTVDPVLSEALNTVSDFIRQVTGLEASHEEIADALTRYFVLKEIKDHIVMMRDGSE